MERGEANGETPTLQVIALTQTNGGTEGQSFEIVGLVAQSGIQPKRLAERFAKSLSLSMAESPVDLHPPKLTMIKFHYDDQQDDINVCYCPKIFL